MRPIVAKFASSAEAAFVVAEAYWKGKAPDALAFATSGEKFAADLGAMATLKSKEGVQYATKQMTPVCSECHDAHRQRQDDGTFQIK
jgi:cytochrome c556